MAEDGSKETPPKLSEIFASPLIKVKVREEGHEFNLHRALLTYHSGFFRGALSNPAFKEAEDGVVTLADVELNTFNAFVDIIYTGALAPPEEWDARYIYSPSSASEEECMRPLTDWYIFADKYIVPFMQREVMDAAVQVYSKECPWYNDVTKAFDHLPENSSFLQLLIDSHAQIWGGVLTDLPESMDAIDSLPVRFLYRVMARQKEVHACDPDTATAIRPRDEYNELFEDPISKMRTTRKG